MGERSYSISALAREFGITTRTIRFYEEKGYIHPRREGGQRRYTPADRVRIKLILRGKRIGLSLAESVEIIDMYQPGENNAAQLASLIERIEARRAQLVRQRADLDAMLASLDEVDSLCRDALRERQTHAAPGAHSGRRETAGAGTSHGDGTSRQNTSGKDPAEQNTTEKDTTKKAATGTDGQPEAAAAPARRHA
ncbi:MerR family transcriptional regulator [Pseudohaliea rubra]|uniref:Putative transcriptional regulator LiuR of leucine degradation pathway, MerR family n=1 Tax=Pseudohaliea rubra DSM 19751 TaxID=1265313 RepID=A0A095VN63_9GAMM|nr:MerR family DNA-binding transcriptional regulator [Pseudohaliea rubra]KGE02917.1 putative transcriptional regulator LiuR of leucine degradation pathway, MerR family [Pseudohaliea rubra DSM 19751]